ncbi:transposase [Methylobacterium sp. WL7]|uniref:transposase n=1 Tax=Methylobacterium sp. WL7 TaxID=2603900 RepID=UPI001FEF3194|nr:transposase [Methylobacterium sp. WL7]
MSPDATLDADVPNRTVVVADAAFPRGHAYLGLRDALRQIYTDAQFVFLFARGDQPAAYPWRLALITLLQFSESLSDRRSADAVHAVIDWNYLLRRALFDTGVDASVLNGCRFRLVVSDAAACRISATSAAFRPSVAASAPMRPMPSGAVYSLNRLGCAIEAVSTALNALLIAAPE